MAFTAQSVSRSHPITSSTPSIAVHGSFLPVNSDRVGSAGREITPSVLPSAFPRHRSSVAVSGAYVCVCGHKLSLTAALPLPPTPPAMPTVSARSRSAVNPQPPLAVLSPQATKALRDNRAADVGLLRSVLHSRGRHTVSLVPPTHIGRSRLHYKPPARQLPSLVCDAMPTPGPDARCADAQTPLRLSANHFAHSELPAA